MCQRAFLFIDVLKTIPISIFASELEKSRKADMTHLSEAKATTVSTLLTKKFDTISENVKNDRLPT